MKYKFIDIHAHAYRADTPRQDGRNKFVTPEQVLSRYDELGIEAGCLLPLIGPEVYLPQSNEYILDVCGQSNGRFIPFCNIDPRGITNSPDAPFDIWLDHYIEKGCKGVGEVMPNIPFLDERAQNLFKHIEKTGLPMTFDISARIGGNYGFYDDQGLPQLEATLKNFPELKIFGHGPAFWAEIGKLESPDDRAGYPSYSFREEGVVPKLLRRYPNLYGDLSAGSGFNALSRNPEYAVQFLNEFQDKLLFGTDICVFTQKIELPNFLNGLRESGKISNIVFNKIARENAIRILGL
jgi:predicted TIM-barrel fold metal-dependent hydrolase